MTTEEVKQIFIRTVDNDTSNKLEDIFTNNEIKYTIEKEHTKNKPDTTEIYNWTCMEFKQDDSYYNLCNIFKIKIDGLPQHTIDFVKELLSNNFNKKSYTGRITSPTKYSIRFKTNEYKFITNNINYESIPDSVIPPKYDICILSLGRYETNYTHNLLCDMNIYHYLFVEDKEFSLYQNKINSFMCKLINCGSNPSELQLGSSPMRNYILNYFYEKGEKRIWMLDDNIQKYQRMNNGQKIENYDKNVFTSIEHIGICSHNVGTTVKSDGQRSIIIENGKHYSSMLLLTTPEFRFSWKYNEDIGISIDYILSGKLNLCFNHMLFIKNTSGKDKGGNTNTIYQDGSYQGYLTKYTYLYEKLKEMYELKILNLTKPFDSFIYRKDLDKGQKPHHNINYRYIKVDNRTRFPYYNIYEYENLENFEFIKQIVNTE